MDVREPTITVFKDEILKDEVKNSDSKEQQRLSIYENKNETFERKLTFSLGSPTIVPQLLLT